jgi:hypothetical protein
MGSIDESEFHKRTKEQIGEIVKILGVPYLLMVLFGFLGTTVPIIGNAAGAAAGFITGVLLGDKVYQILSIQTLVDGLYDMFLLDDTTKIKQFIPAVIDGLTNELPRLIKAQAAESFERATSFFDPDNAMQMDTAEEIKSKFGEDAGNLEILERATVGAGTDEGALAYAFREIKTTSDYLAFKNRFENEFMPEYNDGRIFGRVGSMEEYLQKELRPVQYEQLAEQIKSQIAENENIEKAKLNEFISDTIGVDTRPQITGFGGASEEEFKLFKAGEVVPVTLRDGSRELMTEEQILTSDEIGIAARESALERIERNKNIAERQGITYTPEQNQESNITPRTREQEGANILVVPPPRQTQRPMNNLAGTKGPVQYTPATPTRQIDDSFVDLAYLT